MKNGGWRRILAGACLWAGLLGANGAEAEETGAAGGRKERDAGARWRARREAAQPDRAQGPMASLQSMLQDPEQADRFGLTPAQTARLQEGFETLEEQRGQLRAALVQAGRRQAELMTEEALDAEAILKAVEEAGRIRTEIAKLRVHQLFLLRDTLTREQIEELRRQRRRRRHEKRDAAPRARGDKKEMKD